MSAVLDNHGHAGDHGHDEQHAPADDMRAQRHVSRCPSDLEANRRGEPVAVGVDGNGQHPPSRFALVFLYLLAVSWHRDAPGLV